MTGALTGTAERVVASEPGQYILEVFNADTVAQTISAYVYDVGANQHLRRQVAMAVKAVYHLWGRDAPLVLEDSEYLSLAIGAAPTTSQPTYQVRRIG